ncbi:6-carboxytetrahydropterin synthase [Parvularcula dongshanensis]|uniref:6-carboxy-5,6,7,8-tetrahydropterin synthase n=1 Tax=Parvularcula dongshanensis TaxID=1173995 RepID=A0A840I6T3_9PROT|nr:6-pyruvoyltetrahydropterin/6-carboxytetrahydropterin synthase [Parvularcula dongshanensis]
MYEQSYSFGFEAAHELADNVGPGHDYAHVHGHSFRVTVTLRADAPGPQGWIEDFAVVRAACDEVRGVLDHRFLNRVEGLERPTLEVIARWIFDRLSPSLPALAGVEVSRPSLCEVVRYWAS